MDLTNTVALIVAYTFIAGLFGLTAWVLLEPVVRWLFGRRPAPSGPPRFRQTDVSLPGDIQYLMEHGGRASLEAFAGDWDETFLRSIDGWAWQVLHDNGHLPLTEWGQLEIIRQVRNAHYAEAHRT